MKKEISFRKANPNDLSLILKFIKELAVYEEMLDDVVATEESLSRWIFDEEKSEVIFGIVDGVEIGFALFFHNFSTFLGKAGLYLEDLYIKEKYRKNGYGTEFFKKLAEIAVERDCGRLEWTCLNWNRPSIDFYLKIGAKPMSDWTTYRLDADTIKKVANRKN